MSNGKNDDALLVIVVVVLLVIAYCIWAMAAALDLAPRTVWCVVLRLSPSVFLFVGSLYLKHWFEPIRLGNTWPFVLAASWWAIWPALDDWGGKLDFARRFAFEPPVPWWASDGLQWSVLAVILVGGAGWVWWKNRW